MSKDEGLGHLTASLTSIDEDTGADTVPGFCFWNKTRRLGYRCWLHRVFQGERNGLDEQVAEMGDLVRN